MAKQIYTLQEGEHELFVLRADSIVMPGSGMSYLKSLIATQRAMMRKLPIIGRCCGKGYVDIVVTDKRILVINRDICWCCHEEATVTALSTTVLDGYNSYSFTRTNACCFCWCPVYNFTFSIGFKRGAVAQSILFTTGSVKTPEEAAAVLAKFDELVSK